MIRLIIFGIGEHLQNRIDSLVADVDILAFSDNKSCLWGQEFLGKQVIAPDEILNQNYDVVVIASNKYYREINRQLSDLGIRPDQIYPLDLFLARQKRGQISYYGTDDASYSADALIVCPDLNYSGGPLAGVYAAKVLQKDYEKVCIVAPSGDKSLIREINCIGIDVAIVPSIMAPGPVELALAENAKFVFVDVYSCIAAACEFSLVKPVFWWIHENSDWIDKINDYYHCHEIVPDFHRIHTVAVCSNVRANLKKAWPDLPVSIMNYGLPDFYQPDSVARSYGHPIIFAVVGSVIHRKAQDIFVKAAIRYNKVCDVPAEFWIIGSGSQSEYFTSVMSMAENTANIIWKGELTREEIEAVYPQINVIVCPSRQEGIPIVVNEGLMNAKVCIVADTAGDNDYIVDGESGFFFHSEDADELADKMAYAAENYDNLGKMRQKARQVYVDHYSMESFRTRLEKEIRSAIDEWQPDEPEAKHSIFCCQDQD